MEPGFSVTELVRCSLAAEVLLTSGHLRLRAMGTSMLPAIWPGDELVIHRAAIDEFRRGEHVLFMRGGSLFVHRVIGRSGSLSAPALLTRGDAMPAPDAPVTREEVLGRVVEIRRIGRPIHPRGTRFLSRAIGMSLNRSDRLRGLALRLHQVRSRLHRTPAEAR